MRCICSNHGCIQILFLNRIKSPLYFSFNYSILQFKHKVDGKLDTRFIKLAVVPKRGSEWRGPTPLISA